MAEPFFSTRIDAIGSGGNIFAVVGSARRLMKQIKVDESKIDDMTSRVRGAGSYGEALAVVREWFHVDTDDDED